MSEIKRAADLRPGHVISVARRDQSFDMRVTSMRRWLDSKGADLTGLRLTYLLPGRTQAYPPFGPIRRFHGIVRPSNDRLSILRTDPEVYNGTPETQRAMVFMVTSAARNEYPEYGELENLEYASEDFICGYVEDRDGDLKITPSLMADAPHQALGVERYNRATPGDLAYVNWYVPNDLSQYDLDRLLGRTR